jgi:transcriptional regulator with XRE-family HTH domain
LGPESVPLLDRGGLDNAWWMKDLIATRSFGTAVQREREAQGISLRGLAKRAGISRSALAQYERGTQLPGLEASERIAAALGHSLGYMVHAIEDRGRLR